MSRAQLPTPLHPTENSSGEIYDSKTEHCNNFLHWVDFTLLNSVPDVTNFFVRTNRAATKYACEGGEDCIENSPLFSLVGEFQKQ